MRPTAFDSFRNFVRWRDTVTSVVWLVLSQAVRDTWLPTPRSSPAAAAAAAVEGGTGASEGASARSLLARLRGGLRRLDVRTVSTICALQGR